MNATYSTTGNGFTITISFEDGSEVFMQGDEAGELIDQLEACATDEQEQLILSAYEDVAEMPDHDDDSHLDGCGALSGPKSKL